MRLRLAHESATGAGPGELLHRIRGRADLARRRPGPRVVDDFEQMVGEAASSSGRQDVRGRPVRDPTRCFGGSGHVEPWFSAVAAHRQLDLQALGWDWSDHDKVAQDRP